MNILKLLLFYVIILGIGGIFTWLKVPTQYSLVFFVILTIALVAYYAFTMTSSKSTKAMLRQVRFQKRNPIYAHILAIKDGTKEDEIEALDRLIKKNKNNHDGRMDYEFQRAVRLGDLVSAQKIANSMKNGPLKTYNVALAEALTGKYGVARNKPFYQPWMIHCIEAVIAKKQNSKERYQAEMEKAVEESKGIQRLINQVTYEKTLKEWK